MSQDFKSVKIFNFQAFIGLLLVMEQYNEYGPDLTGNVLFIPPETDATIASEQLLKNVFFPSPPKSLRVDIRGFWIDYINCHLAISPLFGEDCWTVNEMHPVSERIEKLKKLRTGRAPVPTGS